MSQKIEEPLQGQIEQLEQRLQQTHSVLADLHERLSSAAAGKELAEQACRELQGKVESQANEMQTQVCSSLLFVGSRPQETALRNHRSSG